MAKVVLTDNFNREYIAESLLAENLTEEEADRMVDEYNKKYPSNWDWFARKKEDDYKLWRGMGELV